MRGPRAHDARIPHTSSRVDGNGALAPALYSWCPRCGEVRAWEPFSDWFDCPTCGERACIHCHPEIVMPLSEIGLTLRGTERLLAAIDELPE